MKCLQVFVVTVLLLLRFSSSKAQNYALNNGFTNNQTITTCSGIFWDSNINGNYAANENYIVTFCPGIVTNAMQFSFTQMNIAAGDTLFVYDGNSSNANLLNSFVNVSSFFSSIIIASDTNSTGCLTFKFVSNGTTQAPGWRADIKCGYSCKQRIQGTIGTTPSKDINGFTNICLNTGGKVEFDVTTVYPDNDLIYHQADTSTYFHWFFGDGKDTLKKGLTNVNHTYRQEGGYNVKVVMVDSNGCLNKVPAVAGVKTGIKPVFRINAPAAICLGDTVKLTPLVAATPATGGIVSTVNGSFFTLPVSGDSLFLPDQQNNLGYKSTILIDQFLPGQTLTNINDLKGIFMNMEHSYLGDLDITITAPNGVTVSLKNYPGAGGCFLGEPVKEPGFNSPLVNIAGKGYDYQFSSTPQFGTMAQEATLHTYSYIDNAGQSVNNRRYLPAGSYTSANSLSALVGTPLNGTWILKIQDHLAVDNGFLFNWRLDFNPSIYPNVQVFNVPLVSQNWVTPSPGIVQLNGTMATIVPQNAGTNSFIYRVVDGFGCTFDTTINLQVKVAPIKPDLGSDIALCNGQTSTILMVSNVDNTANYSWSNGQSGTGLSQINANSSGPYYVTASNSFNCSTKDTIVVTISNSITASLGADTFYCASKPNVLKPIVSNNVTSYLWSDGSTADTLKIAAPGSYWVKCGATGSTCFVTANVTVSDNPVNSFTMPIDTLICAGSTYNLTLVPPANTSILWNDGVTGNTHAITGPNTYTTVANNMGCLKNGTYNVTTKPVPVVSLGNDTFYCASKPNALRLAISTNVIDYLWNDGSTKDSLKIAGPGTYSVKGTANGCSATDNIIVTDNPVNSYTMPTDTLICDRGSFLLTLTPPANTSILWNDGTVGNSHLITGPNMYTMLANNIGCLKSASYNVTTKPLPIVNVGVDTTLCTNKTYLLKVSYPAASFRWNDNSTDTFLLAKQPGIYWVEGLFNQCTYRDSIEIKYKKCECETILSNAFSPNGDGINEVFAPVMQCVPVNYQISIFNRYGQPVFESRDYLKGWDGKKNGQPLPIGTYYYIITYYNNGLLNTERYSGSITLLR